MPFSSVFEKYKERIAEIKVPDNFLQKIPPAATHEEALRLYQICKHYEKDLCLAGLNSALLEEIPERVAASMEAQAKWLAVITDISDIERQWKALYQKCRELHDELFHELKYFFTLLGYDKLAKHFNGGYITLNELIQSLSDCSTAIRNNKDALAAEGMDVSLGEKAAQYCDEIINFSVKYQLDTSRARSEMKRTRDQALIFVNQTIAEIQSIAFHCFRNDPLTKQVFTNWYRKNHRASGKKENKVKNSEIVGL